MQIFSWKHILWSDTFSDGVYYTVKNVACSTYEYSPQEGNKNLLGSSGEISYFCVRRHPEHSRGLIRQGSLDMHGVHVMVHTLRFRRKEPGCQGFSRKEAFVKYFLPAAEKAACMSIVSYV